MTKNLTLRWYGEAVGTFETGEALSVKNFQFHEPFSDAIFPTSQSGTPNFLENLRPQGMMKQIFNEAVGNDAACNDPVYRFRRPVSRFLSNITITNGDFHQDDHVSLDFHGEKLTNKTNSPFSNFIYFGETPCSSGEFIDKIRRFWAQRAMPRYSGYETKLPIEIRKDSIHVASEGGSFTHLLKLPPQEAYRQSLCFNEWFCLQLSEAAGLSTAKNTLVYLNEEEYPSLISERYDISDNEKPEAWLLTQDGCSLGGEDFTEAANGSYEKLFKVIAKYSTDLDQDREDYFRRIILTVAVQDTDFHKKNISMLFKFDPDSKEILSRRIAPTYDVTSDISSEDNTRRLTLSVAGKKLGINRKAMLNFGKNIGLNTDRTEELLDQTMEDIVDRAVQLSKADFIPDNQCQYVADRITTLVVGAAKKFEIQTPQWNDRSIDKSDLPSLRIGCSAGRFMELM